MNALSGPEILPRVEECSKPVHSASQYTGVRRYSPRYERFKRESEMNIRASHGERGTASFEVLNVIGSEDIYPRVSTKLLQGETQLSTRPTGETALTRANYGVEVRGTETFRGRLFYALALRPRRSGKYLLQGRARIDVESYAVIKIGGRPTASFSFRLGEPLIIRQFDKWKEHGSWQAAILHSERACSGRAN